MFRALPPIIQQALSMDKTNVAPNYLASMQALFIVQQEIWPLIQAYYEKDKNPSLEHGIVPGDWVWVRKGPYVVFLTTSSALKVDRIGPWIHHSHVRKAPKLETNTP